MRTVGKVVLLLSFSWTRAGAVGIGMALDTSGSFHEQLELSQELFGYLVENSLQPDDKTVYLEFDIEQRVRFKGNLSQEKERKELLNLVQGSYSTFEKGTRVFKALQQLHQELVSLCDEDEPIILVVATDGFDDQSQRGEDFLSPRWLNIKRPCSLYLFGLETTSDSGLEQALKMRGMRPRILRAPFEPDQMSRFTQELRQKMSSFARPVQVIQVIPLTPSSPVNRESAPQKRWPIMVIIGGTVCLSLLLVVLVLSLISLVAKNHRERLLIEEEEEEERNKELEVGVESPSQAKGANFKRRYTLLPDSRLIVGARNEGAAMFRFVPEMKGNLVFSLDKEGQIVIEATDCQPQRVDGGKIKFPYLLPRDERLELRLPPIVVQLQAVRT